MKVLQFALNLLLRVVWFAIGGLLYGIAVGLIIGMGIAVLLSLLLVIADINVAGTGATGIGVISLGLMSGGIAGGFLGGVMGLASLVVLAIIISHRTSPEDHFLNAVGGAFRAAWVCALAGGISGALFSILWQISFGGGASQQILKAALEPFSGGFFWGSVIGFCMGFFAGTLIGGLSRKPNWLSLPLSQVRVEMKRKISALWKDNFA